MTITQQDKVSPHKVFLSKLDVPYSKLYKPRGARRTEQHSEDMVLAFNSRIPYRLTVHTKKSKVKRRLREAVGLIVTRGAAVEESRERPKLV